MSKYRIVKIVNPRDGANDGFYVQRWSGNPLCPENVALWEWKDVYGPKLHFETVENWLLGERKFDVVKEYELKDAEL